MDSKNVLFAVILSSVVLIVWSIFFEPTVVEKQTSNNEVVKNDNSLTPSIDKIENKKEISREDALSNVKRIRIENQNIKGSISLKGAIIDDIVFKNYKETLNGDKKVTFLNPKDSKNEYFIETGWASGPQQNIKLPLDNWNYFFQYLSKRVQF